MPEKEYMAIEQKLVDNLFDAEKLTIAERFAVNLRSLRRQKRLSRKELAEKSGVSERTIESYEQGKKIAGIDKLMALAAALECSITVLIGDTDKTGATGTVFNWRQGKCLFTATLAGYWVDFAELPDLPITLTPVEKLTRNANGGISSDNPNPPITMDRQAFVALFERIAVRALYKVDLQQIAAEELQRL